MKKRYIFLVLAIIITIIFFAGLLNEGDKKRSDSINKMPRIGQFLWVYNMNKHQWRNYKEHDDLESKEEIVLQLQGQESNAGFTVYKLYTGNSQIPKDDFWVGESSSEFLKDDNLYSMFPKNFEIYKIVFNGVKFIPDELSFEQSSELFKDFKIIKVSELQKGKYNIKYSKRANKFIILNDIGDKFYKYYIIPNDSKKMQILDLSNQFKVLEPVDIKLQRLEGCSPNYPCYDIHIAK